MHPSPANPKDGAHRRLRVLVIDDSVDTADSTAELLALDGHTVRVAYGGEDAFTIARDLSPDVVLLDIRLHNLDGLELARRLVAGVGTRPFLIAVTACGAQVDRTRSAEAGIDLHLVKPVEPTVLLEVLDLLMRDPVPGNPAEELGSQEAASVIPIT